MTGRMERVTTGPTLGEERLAGTNPGIDGIENPDWVRKLGSLKQLHS